MEEIKPATEAKGIIKWEEARTIIQNRKRYGKVRISFTLKGKKFKNEVTK